MKEINVNLDNLRKVVFQYIIGFNRDIRGVKSEDAAYELSLSLIEELEETNKISEFVHSIVTNTSVSSNFAYSYIIGYCLWDGKAVFHIGSSYFDVKLTYNTFLPYFNRVSLEESYDLINTSNFTERDYEDERDIGFYHESLEASASKQTVLEINEEVMLNHWTNEEKHDTTTFINYKSTLEALYALMSALKDEAVIKTGKETIEMKQLPLPGR